MLKFRKTIFKYTGIKCLGYVLLIAILSSSCRVPSSVVENNKETKINEEIIGSERFIETTRFNKIVINAPIEVTLMQFPECSILLEGKNELISQIESKVENETLTLTFKNQKLLKSVKSAIKAQILLPNIERIEINGNGKVDSKNGFDHTLNLAMLVNGNGNIEMPLNADVLVGNINGSGNISLTGRSINNSINIVGSGTYNSELLDAENLTMTIEGSGNATVYAKSLLNVFIKGSGSVKYSGDAITQSNISGSGKCTKL